MPKKHALIRLMDGITLEDYLAVYAENPQFLNITKLLIHHMAEALAYLHTKDIAHGALTPRNFVLDIDADGNLNEITIDLLNFTSTEKLMGYSEYEHYDKNKTQLSDLYAFGKILQKDFPCQDNEIPELIEALCHKFEARPTASQVAGNFLRSAEWNRVPIVKLTSRLSCFYQKNTLVDLRDKAITKLSTSLVDNVCLRDNTTGNVLTLPEELFRGTCGTLIQYKEGKEGTIISREEFLHIKHKNTSLLELLKLSKTPLKVFKEKALNEIQTLVRRTNNIDELADFFTKLKIQEYNQPFLRKERGLLMGSSGMTDTWKMAINLFKERALELATHEINLKKVLTNPDKYRPILEERRARIFKFESTQLCEFEKAISITP